MIYGNEGKLTHGRQSSMSLNRIYLPHLSSSGIFNPPIRPPTYGGTWIWYTFSYFDQCRSYIPAERGAVGIKRERVFPPFGNCFQRKKKMADLLKELAHMTYMSRILYCAVYNLLRLKSGDFCRF